MTSHGKHFDNKQAAAVLKHALLANYLMPFATMTSSYSQGNRAWYIDAYAGPGTYERKAGESSGAPGSPLIALGISRTLSTFAKPLNLRCIFIEKNAKFAKSLEAIVQAGNFPGEPSVLKGSAESRLPEAVGKVGNDPLLTFLDPFGTSLPRALMISALMQRPDKVPNEVLLNFHLGSVGRIGALLGKPSDLTPEDLKTIARLDAFLGHDDWRDTFLAHYQPAVPLSATAGALAVASQFREKVKTETGYESFAIDIRRAVRGVPIFQLTLFFRHSAAEYKFADAASVANAAWRKRVVEDEARKNADEYPDALLQLDFSEAQFEDKWKRDEIALARSWEASIQSNLRSLLAAKQAVPVQSHVKEIFGEHLGLAGEKHLRAAWKALAADGTANPCPSKIYKETITRK